MTLSPAFANRFLNRIHKGACADILASMPDGSVDMIFADPPYNLQIGAEYGRGELRRPNDSKVEGVHEAWDKIGGFGEYDEFSREWLSQARRVLKDDGTMWVIGSYHNIYRLGAMLQDMGFWILNDVVWVKNNPMPNFRGRRFTNAHETMLWVGKSEHAKYTFNYEAMKAMNDDLQMRSDWRLPICSGQERLKDDQGKKAHPTQKPESLLYRVILSSTKPGDVVLDPFFGTGTTGAMAKRLGRHWIGIERDETYIEVANQRIEQTPASVDEKALALASKREQPRIPFGTLLERGFLRPGDILCDEKQRYSAQVRSDASLSAQDGVKGSIHKVGAAVQGATACNGWTFWHVERDGEILSIDSFRQELRAELFGGAELAPDQKPVTAPAARQMPRTPRPAARVRQVMGKKAASAQAAGSPAKARVSHSEANVTWLQRLS